MTVANVNRSCLIYFALDTFAVQTRLPSDLSYYLIH